MYHLRKSIDALNFTGELLLVSLMNDFSRVIFILASASNCLSSPGTQSDRQHDHLFEMLPFE
jgi:hypothetical protein